MSPLRVAVVGVGHLGRHHARVWSEIPGVELVAVCDVDIARAREVGHPLGVPSISEIADLPAIDAASVVVPTESHLAVTEALLDRGVHCLVEKPMTATVVEGRRLVAKAHGAGRILQPGFIERFNPAVAAVRDAIRDPGYIECVRVSPFRFRSADIGAVMDLMIHDIDQVLTLASDEVERVDAVGVSVLTEREDVVNARIRFRKGCVANLTASRVAVSPKREIRIFQPDAYFSLDYGTGSARIHRKKRGGTLIDVAREAGVDLGEIGKRGMEAIRQFVDIHEVRMDTDEPLRAELEAFAAACRGEAPPVVSAEDGVRALEVAERILGEVSQNNQLTQTGK